MRRAGDGKAAAWLPHSKGHEGGSMAARLPHSKVHLAEKVKIQ